MAKSWSISESSLGSFTATGRVPIELGWRAVLEKLGKKTDDDVLFPPIVNGEPGTILEAELKESLTKPPGRYTEGSILRAMKECWRLVSDEEHDLKERLKEVQGIGTPATRAEIVSGLLEQKQIVKKGKFLEPSKGGMDLYQVLKGCAPNITSPIRTARWEHLWAMVAAGEVAAEEAVERVVRAAGREVDALSHVGVKLDIGAVRKPTSKMVAAAEKIAERKGIKIPPKLKSDATVCRAFLGEHLGGTRRAEGDTTPSEAQVKFARRLAEAIGEDVPSEALEDYRTLSAWISEREDRAPKSPPSDAQLGYARKLAGNANVDIPEDVIQDWKACRDFIDKMKRGKSKSGKPRKRARTA